MGQKINFIGGPSSNNLGSVLFPFGSEARGRILKSGLPGHFVEVRKFVSRTPSGSDDASPDSLARGSSPSAGSFYRLKFDPDRAADSIATAELINSSRPSYEQVRMGDDLIACTTPGCGYRGILPHEVRCPYCKRPTPDIGE
jgi:hypothetical protein